MAGGSAERGQATRERLLEAAVSLVGEVGWNSVTTRLVAERAGVNPGLVHYHFSSVSDLLVVASMDFARRLLSDVAERLTEHADLGEGVDWLFGELDGYSGTDPVSMSVTEAFLAASRLPDLRAELATLIHDFRARTADWMRANGYDGDAAAAATLIAATVDGLMVHRAVEPTLDIKVVCEPLRRMLTFKEARR